MTRRGRATRGVRSLAAGCLATILLLGPVPAHGQHRSDWSDVRAVPTGTKTQVRLYDDEAPPGARRVRGVFASATESSITLLMQGESRTFERRAVRRVRVPRPWYVRYPGWLALAGTVFVAGFVASNPGEDFDESEAQLMLTGPVAAVTAILFRSTAKVKEVYNVPPKHRIP